MRSLCLVAVLALTACSWDADPSDLTVTVNGISQSTTDNVNHLVVTVTLPDGPHTYTPTFGPQSTSSVDLSINTNGQSGTYTINVVQMDRSANPKGPPTGTTVTGTLTPPSTSALPVNLPPTGT
jgi:hypothetical protein